MKSLLPSLSAVTAATVLINVALLPVATSAQAPAPVRIEPGLETAVTWKWWVAPSDETAWGLPPPQSGPASPDSAGSTPSGPRPATYEVQRGDALVKIGRKFGMTADQLRSYNGLTGDTIQIGQVLKIPSLVELTMMAPAPGEPKAADKAADGKKTAPSAPKGPMLSSEAKSELETVLIQAYLDRQNFSTGPIDGRGGPIFNKTLEVFQSVFPEMVNREELRERAQSELTTAYTTYQLKAEDFRFIAPPKELGLGSGLRRKSKSAVKDAEPPPAYEELVSAPMLAYRTAWEFVAERFHCEEAFLRKLNAKVTGLVSVGTEFLVPNVLPFEIENVFQEPLQPPANPANSITAAVVDLARIEIYSGEKVIAVMPMTVARPDLRGRGAWTILDALPRPRLATLQEVKEPPKKKPVYSFPTTAGAQEPEPPPAPAPALSSEQYLPPGPNNPVGIIWINLAKSNSTEPLPYGLHGTSIPERMRTQESIGGLRLANWDIARAVRLLPAGTPLKWK